MCVYVYKCTHACVSLRCIGALTGFINIGDINTQLLEFEQTMCDSTNPTSSKTLANSMLVFMVRGLFSNLEFPYAQFPCAKLTGEQMFLPFWEAVGRLERCGFKVIAATADGLSVNRHFFKLHGDDSQALIHKALNPYAPEQRYIYFFSDPPHLIKTVRNCWASSKRTMWVCQCKGILYTVHLFLHDVHIV